MKGSHRPLPHDYLHLLLAPTPLQLVIMGKDPFPNDPTGIPFCKKTWDQQMVDKCSGLHVLQSLGFDIKILKESFCEPPSFFRWLAQDQRIGFLNLSYDFIGAKIRKVRHQQLLTSAWEINRPIIERALHLVLCGEADKNRWNQPIQENYMKVCHPDIRNRNNPKKADEWRRYWNPRALTNLFSL